MKRSLFVAILLFLTQWVYSQSNKISLYEDCNYNGKQLNLKPGSYRPVQYSSTMRKKISSMKVPAGFIVKVYTGDNFNGSSAIYTRDVACLDSTFNNNIGSMIVEQISPGTKAVNKQ